MSEIAYLPAGKRELTKVANRQAIMDAAREVFGELGYETATVRDIIRRTGLAAGTFYNYYRSKDEVYLALSAEGARQFAPLLKAQRAQSADWNEFVRAAIGAYFLFLSDAHKTWLARRPPEEVVPHVHGETPEMAAVFNEVREAIVDEIAMGRAPAADPDYVAAACIAIARDVGERMLTRRPIDTQGATEFAVAMIQGGLQGLPKSKA
ncbi:TetR/AcrR family transcriptional regulator [Phenylobacterium sp.]|uniref:TetR/AcrR family transcriptional regulator n=1 Tax=Phenylobacterium sp. TaxID=1871053 RepID=UPI00272F72CA|nr:TetR/AcrR family transcriptional regulator [Phenylobacterium sp.]MDP1601174.1 TetR/AcrR family transcriptional regulator [Phenylobacterium sp.]MDP3590929.1 TetR/AcrR family transcriptional regulator [Phenylobacterium sp.]